MKFSSSPTPSPVAREFVQQALFHFEANTSRVETCLAQLSQAQVWQRPNAASNSIGNLVLHLCGNIGQYILASLAQQPDTREREAEFAAQGGYHKAELLAHLQDTSQQAVAVMRQATEEELLRVRTVQGFEMSGIGVILHAVEHYSYHVGQIAFWTKALLDRDLGFYAGLDLDQTGEE